MVTRWCQSQDSPASPQRDTLVFASPTGNRMARRAAAALKSLLKLRIPAGGASAAPPTGPALGQAGVNIMEFCKDFNARSGHLVKDTPVPVVVKVFEDRTFEFTTGPPPTSFFLKRVRPSPFSPSPAMPTPCAPLSPPSLAPWWIVLRRLASPSAYFARLPPPASTPPPRSLMALDWCFLEQQGLGSVLAQGDDAGCRRNGTHAGG